MEELLMQDPVIGKAIVAEVDRQMDKLEMIASENFVSSAVRQAQGSVFTNKYAEGYPGKRYYGGCEFVDIAESAAIDRAKQLFSCAYANVQPHSGSQANMAVYFAALDPGDVILGMNLSHGGHLTHGSPVNFSGRLYKVVPYGVDPETGLIDEDELLKLAKEHKPKAIIAGASAYPRTINFVRFREIADEVGAKLIVDMAHIAGLVATNTHPTPLPHAHFVTSTTHKTLRGPRGGLILSSDISFEKVLNSQIFPGIQGGPLMHVIAAKAVAFGEALRPEFVKYQEQVLLNAKVLAKNLISAGFKLVSGGTDTHLLLLDFTNFEYTGKDAETALDKAGITANKNTVPFEKRSPFITSGLRLGVPALTTRGLKEDHMTKVAEWVELAIKFRDNESKLKEISREVASFARQFPLFAW